MTPFVAVDSQWMGGADMADFKRFNTNIYLAVLLAAVMMALAGCAPVYVQTGPDAARIQVELSAVTNDAEINRAGGRFGLTGYLTTFGVWRELKGPFWDWGLYLVKDDGRLLPLQPEGGVNTKNLLGYGIERSVSFLVPPGEHKIRLLVESHMEFWVNSMAYGSEYEMFPVSDYTRDYDFNLTGGEVKKIKAGFGKPGQMNTIRRTY
jgi:hypothetical protein